MFWGPRERQGSFRPLVSSYSLALWMLSRRGYLRPRVAGCDQLYALERRDIASPGAETNDAQLVHERLERMHGALLALRRRFEHRTRAGRRIRAERERHGHVHPGANAAGRDHQSLSEGFAADADRCHRRNPEARKPAPDFGLGARGGRAIALDLRPRRAAGTRNLDTRERQARKFL